MIADRLKRLTVIDLGHGVLAAGAAVAAALTVSAGLAVARAGPLERADTIQRVATATGGQYSEAALRRLIAGMDPAAIGLALRHDPAPGLDFEAGWLPGDPPRLLQFLAVEGAQARRINADLPFSDDGLGPAAPFVLAARNPAERQRAVRCLANAIYYEAALEPVGGQRAVAQVVLNRVRDPNFPKSICGVVYEGWERVTGCQFSFTCDGALVRTPVPALWAQARQVAEEALNGRVEASVGSATHYHADYVAPYWAPSLVKISQIGAHIFYRWPGEAGLPQALTAHYLGGEMRLSEAVLSGRAARALPTPSDQDNPLAVRTMVSIDPTTGERRTRLQATIDTAPPGRRQATPEEIAHINALLEARFPTKAATAGPTPEAAAPAPVAAANDMETAAVG
jgi:hypothetical protein